jgi:hypothetical protein
MPYMGLLDKIFGGGSGSSGTGKERDAPAGSASTQFRESAPDSDDSQDSQASRNAPRRELVQVILRDTMRKHGIPSDWVECRMLSTVSRTGRHGLHVNFVVKQAHQKLLAYVFAFQDSFERELARFEPRARDWLLSIGWEFQGFNAAEMPDPRTWVQSGAMPLQPHAGPMPLVKPDWEAPKPSDFGGLEDTLDPAAAETAETARRSEEDVQQDLKALFAIRDAAMKQTADPRDPPDFQPTRPFDEDDLPRKR